MAAKPRALTFQLAPPSLLTRKTTTSTSLLCNFKLTRHASTLHIVKANDETINATTVVAADSLNNKTTPWLLLPPEVDPETGEKLDCFYSLADSQTVRLNRKKSLKVPDTAKCIASTLGSWLGFADTKDGSLYLSNPFSNDVVELPSLGTLPQVAGIERDPKTGSILRFKVAPPYYDCEWDDGDVELYDLMTPEVMVDDMISHLALSYEDPRDFNCVVMAVQSYTKRLAYCDICKICHPDSHNAAHVWFGLQEEYRVTGTRNQVAYDSRKKMFFSLCDDGMMAFDVESNRGRRSKKVVEFDMDSLEKERKEGLPKWLERLNCEVEYYLLTLRNSGDLWLIVRHLFDKTEETSCPYETLHFDVFRVASTGRLERMTYLEDRAIFIGSNQSFCIRTGGSPGIRPNCIYFTDDREVNRWGHDMGIFNMEDGVITPFYPYQDEKEEKNVPITMPLFWIAPFSSGLPREYLAT